MKENKNDTTRSARAFSVFAGVFIGFSAWVLAGMLYPEKAFPIALAVGVLTTLATSIVTPLILRAREKRYDGIEETLPQPVLLKTRVSIRGAGGARDGVLFLTEDRLYLYSRDRKPYASETIERADLRDLKLEQGVLLSFRVDKALYSIASTQGQELLDLMRQHGWNVL